jgi:taurine dioxygenase
MTKALTITPLTTSIGARIEGVDMRREIPPEHAVQIRKALDDYFVLHIPGQHIGLDEHIRFSTVWGEPEPLPTVKFLGSNRLHVNIDPDTVELDERSLDWRRIDYPEWHTDSSFTAYVPHVAVLRGEILSPVGGGTSWTNMCAAYDGLSPGMQDWLGTLKAVHWYPDHYKHGMKFDTFPLELQQRFDDEFPPREHPVVFEHPSSGRRGLFVNPGYTQYIAGLSAKESRAILRFLYNHATASDFVYRHRWTEGDIMVWDELATMHLAPQDYRPHPRRVVRVNAGRLTPKAPARPAAERELALQH